MRTQATERVARCAHHDGLVVVLADQGEDFDPLTIVRQIVALARVVIGVDDIDVVALPTHGSQDRCKAVSSV